MSASSSLMGFARSSSKHGAVHLDPVTLALSLAIVLLGLVMVTSASVSIAGQESGQPFYYLERQLFLTLIGGACAALVFSIPTELLERASLPLLAIAIALLVIVLVPGLGHSVNGSRRWLRLAGANFQVSELARVLVLIYIASYAVRREAELRESFVGLGKPLLLLFGVCALLLLEPDFGAATVLFATGFAVLFVAGARLRYVLVLVAAVSLSFAVLALTSAYRLKRLTGFLHPWDDPFNGGFQLTQSLIAIGRGEWFGVGLGESVQKLFYLPEAHTDFLFAVLAEEQQPQRARLAGHPCAGDRGRSSRHQYRALQAPCVRNFFQHDLGRRVSVCLLPRVRFGRSLRPVPVHSIRRDDHHRWHGLATRRIAGRDVRDRFSVPHRSAAAPAAECPETRWRHICRKLRRIRRRDDPLPCL